MLHRYSKQEERVRPKSDFTIQNDAKKKVLNPNVISRTNQSGKDRSDINQIVKKGILSTGISSQRRPQFGDFSNSQDFLSQQNKVAQFRADFEALPSHIRDKFSNQPESYLEFMQNPENKEEAVKLGLLPKPVIKHTKELVGDKYQYVTTKDGVEISRIDVPTSEASPTTPTATPEA